ncbi:hypothetical protein GF337_01270 [candidate division KSB1 bacterium]|nr:hypothetical protein [candidate division KSB1 bacterium]
MKITLITPPGYSHIEMCETIYETAAITAIHKLCEQEHIVLDGNELLIGEMYKRLDDYEPDVITLVLQDGYGCWQWLSELSKYFEDQLELYTWIALGKGAAALQFQLLNRFPVIDFVVRGEPDISYSELLEAIENGTDIGLIKGIIFRADDRLGMSPAQKLNIAPAALPLPIYQSLREIKCLPLYMSNRLHHGNGFLLTDPLGDYERILKSPNRLISEIETINAHKPPVFFLDDNIFQCIRENNENIEAYFTQVGEKITEFHLRLTSADLDENILQRLKQSGLSKIFVTIVIRPGFSFIDPLDILKKVKIEYEIECILFAPDISMDEFFQALSDIENDIMPDYEPCSGYSVFRQMELFPENIEKTSELKKDLITPEIKGIHHLVNFYKKKRISLFYEQIFSRDKSQPDQFDDLRKNVWKLDFRVLRLLSDHFQNIKSGKKITKSIFDAIQEFNSKFQILSKIGIQ